MTDRKETTYYHPSYITLDEYMKGATLPVVVCCALMGGIVSIAVVMSVRDDLSYDSLDILLMGLVWWFIPFAVSAFFAIPISEMYLRWSWSLSHTNQVVRDELIVRGEDITVEDVPDIERLYPLNGVDITDVEAMTWRDYIGRLTDPREPVSLSHANSGMSRNEYEKMRDRLQEAGAVSQHGTNYRVSNDSMLRSWWRNLPRPDSD